MNIVETQHLNFRFNKQPIIQDLNLQVPENAVYGFLGPNGAGKSTSIKLLLGLLRPKTGSISIFGKNLQTDNLAILARVGNLIENPSLYQHLTAYDNLQYMNLLFKMGKNRIDEILDMVGLAHARNKKVKHFSMGMKQRLGIGMAVFHDPDLLILDEPVNGLDPSGIQEMRTLFLNLRQMGKTLLLSSHLLSEIEKTCTHIGIIQKGKLRYQGPIEQLTTSTTRIIRLKVDQPDRALSICREKNIETIVNEDWLELSVPSDDGFNVIIASLVNQGIALYDVERRSASLEELFIDLTSEINGKPYSSIS